MHGGFRRPFHFKLIAKSFTGGALSGLDFYVNGVRKEKKTLELVCNRVFFLLKKLHRCRKQGLGGKGFLPRPLDFRGKICCLKEVLTIVVTAR